MDNNHRLIPLAAYVFIFNLLIKNDDFWLDSGRLPQLGFISELNLLQKNLLINMSGASGLPNGWIRQEKEFQSLKYFLLKERHCWLDVI